MYVAAATAGLSPWIPSGTLSLSRYLSLSLVLVTKNDLRPPEFRQRVAQGSQVSAHQSLLHGTGDQQSSAKGDAVSRDSKEEAVLDARPTIRPTSCHARQSGLMTLPLTHTLTL